MGRSGRPQPISCSMTGTTGQAPRDNVPVVDASVVVDWVAPDVDPSAASPALLRRLAATDDQLFAPRLLIEEVSNALLSGIRRSRWTGAEADRAQALIRRLPVRLVDTAADFDRAWDLARRYDNHPIYDMLYVALAERLRIPLITADDSLRTRLAGFPWIVPPAADVS